MRSGRGGYRKIVEWSDEDNCYIGTCPELMYGGIHGQDEMEVYKELCQAVSEIRRINRHRRVRRVRKAS